MVAATLECGQIRGISSGANISNLKVRTPAIELNNPAAPISVPSPPVAESVPSSGTRQSDPTGAIAAPPPPVPPPHTAVPQRIALFHEYGVGIDRLVVNHLGRYPGGVRIVGNVAVEGTLTEASSLAVKDEVRTLSTDEAMAALDGLNAVTYRYKSDDPQARRVGFIAEDVPDLVAQPGRDRLSPMDLVAVLTTVVQEQQRTITRLAAEIEALRPEPGSASCLA